MENKDLDSNSPNHQTTIEEYTPNESNGYASMGFVPATNSNGNDYSVNENEPIHQGASLVTPVAIASPDMKDTKNGFEKATLNGTSHNDGTSDLVHPITNGHVEAITKGVSNLELNGKVDHNTDGLSEWETKRVSDIEDNGETKEEGYVNHDIIGPEDEDDGDTQTIPDRDIAVSGVAKKKKKPKSKRGLVT